MCEFSDFFESFRVIHRKTADSGAAELGQAGATAEALPEVSEGDMFAADEVALGDADGDDSLDIFITGDGESLIRSTARVVLGNAITSRIPSSPLRSITTRSRPRAMPPCGGAP